MKTDCFAFYTEYSLQLYEKFFQQNPYLAVVFPSYQ